MCKEIPSFAIYISIRDHKEGRKTIMKKWIRMLMAALISVVAMSASAQAFADQPTLSIADVYRQAQTGWHRSYPTARGETVSVDIDIAVPDVSAFPCYYAEDMQPAKGVPTSKKDMAEYGEAATINDPGFFRYDWPNGSIRRQWQTAARENGTMLESFGEPRALVLRYGHFDMDTAYSVNNPSTMRDAEALMAECIQTFFSDEAIGLTPHYLHAHIDPGKYEKNKAINDYEKVRDDPDFQGCLFACFDQTIDGIPVLGYGYQGYADYKGAGMRDESQGMLGGLCITQGLRDMGREELYRSLQLKLISVTDLIAGDVPFCPVDAVIQTAEQLISAGQLRTVDSMRLGYVVWLDQTNTYKLMPTWGIEGELFADAAADYRTPMTILTDIPSEYANVYINAQTGELIDPWKSNKNRAYDAPSLIPWR